MKLFGKIWVGLLSILLLVSVPAPVVSAQDYKNPSLKKAVQHIFFKDNYQGNILTGHLIRVDLTNPMIELDLALAYNNTNRKERLPEMAERFGAIAAVNGSFFQSRNSIDSAVGLLITNGLVLADSGHRRTSLGITYDKKIIIGVPKVKNFVIMPELGISLKLNSINQVRRKNQITLYSNYFGTHTRTKGAGREILVDRNGRLFCYKVNNSPIPPGGFVISISGAGPEVAERFPLGALVYMESVMVPPWNKVRTLLTGSPQLLKKGKIYNTFFKEKLQMSLKFPASRTAIGVTHNKKLLMLTVNGNLTLTKLAMIMKRLGATDALALDGGGSTDMFLKGENVGFHYRPVTNALVVKINRG